MDAVEVYIAAAGALGRLVAELSDEQWAAPTWPDDWTVRTTVAWVVVGDAQIPTAVAGGVLEPPEGFDVGVLGANPVAAWRGTALAAIAALRADGVLDRRVELGGRPMLVADVVGQRATENIVRAHDVAWATGRTETLEAEIGAGGSAGVDLADWCLDFWSGHTEAVLAGGVMPESPVEPPAEPTALERLLALTGRAARRR